MNRLCAEYLNKKFGILFFKNYDGEGERSQKGGNFYWRGKQLYIKQIECKQRNRKARYIIYFNQSHSYISLLIKALRKRKINTSFIFQMIVGSKRRSKLQL